MNPQSQIDEALHWIGSAPPPEGLEQRVNSRLHAPKRGFPVVRFFSAMAIAASVAVGSVVLIPGLKEVIYHDGHANSRLPHTFAHPAGTFGGASAAHVLAAPVPVQPTPVNQGRGHSRSARTAFTSVDRKPLPRGVALPREVETRIPPSTTTATAIPAQR